MHQHGLMRGKPGGIIITSSYPPKSPNRSQILDHEVSSVQRYMMTEGMGVVGSVGIMGARPLYPVHSRGTIRNERNTKDDEAGCPALICENSKT
jgi:hypothetical protein